MGEPSPSAAQATQDEASTAATFPVVCDTGEPLLARLQQCLREFKLVELHWFLPAPLLHSILLKEESENQHCYCHPPTEKRRQKTVADAFTWLLCFNCYVGA